MDRPDLQGRCRLNRVRLPRWRALPACQSLFRQDRHAAATGCRIWWAIRQIGDRFEFGVLATPKDPKTGIRAFDLIEKTTEARYSIRSTDRGTAELAVEYHVGHDHRSGSGICDRGNHLPSLQPGLATKRTSSNHLRQQRANPNGTRDVRTYASHVLRTVGRGATGAFTSEFDKAYTGEVPARDALAAACAAVDKVLVDYADEIKPWPYDFGFPLEGMTRANSEWF